MGQGSNSKSTSASRVAKLAAKGKGKGRQVRFKGGTLFPAVLVGIAALGAALVVYSRESIPNRNVPPTINDHWHASYGFYACDSWLPDLQGAKEDLDTAGQLFNTEFRRTGIHSHDDGVIHWHPYTSAATGRNAKLGVFLDVYGVKVTDTRITFPPDQGGAEYIEGTTKCLDANGNSVDGEVVVFAYDSYSDASKFTTYITNFSQIRIDKDGMAFTIAFVAPGTNPGMPRSATNLPELGAIDSGVVPPTTPDPSEPSAPSDSDEPSVEPDPNESLPGATTTIAGPTTTTGG